MHRNHHNPVIRLFRAWTFADHFWFKKLDFVSDHSDVLCTNRLLEFSFDCLQISFPIGILSSLMPEEITEVSNCILVSVHVIEVDCYREKTNSSDVLWTNRLREFSFTCVQISFSIGNIPWLMPERIGKATDNNFGFQIRGSLTWISQNTHFPCQLIVVWGCGEVLRSVSSQETCLIEPFEC